MNEKIVLIDGHSILNRAFYGVPELTNAEGLHTNAIYGFLNIMFKMLEEEKPEYLTVAFDVHAPTFRHEMYPEYKGTRKPMMDELREQVPVMKEVLRAMGVKIIEQAGLEADDLLGTLSVRCEAQGMDVTIISGDRDLLQLATQKVKIRIPKTKHGRTEVEDYYADDVKERYQVTPKEFIDLKALMGDASDNIPGVPSIGEKTATKIITEYGCIENAFEHVEELKPPRASKAMQEHYDLAELSKVLATINVQADFEYELQEARLENLYTQEAYEWFRKLQFKNLLSRFDMQPQANAIEQHFKKVTKVAEMKEIFAKAWEADTVGIAFYKDTTNVLPLFVQDATLTGVGICFGKDKIYTITTEDGIGTKELLEYVEALSKAVKTISIFHVKEALTYLPKLSKESSFDGIIAAYLLNPLKNDYSFEDVAREQLQLMISEKADELTRCFYEAYTAYAACKPLRESLDATGMAKIFDEMEIPLAFVLRTMEDNGVRVNANELRSYGEELGRRIVEIEKSIYEMTGEEFNINSPKQLGVVLFEHMGIPNGKKTKTGYSTAADILEKLAPDYPVISTILEYRQLTKLKSTYADGLAHYICEDGRIHGKFHQTVTATGRLSSSEPNLQNIPVRMELGRLIRKVFVPEEGYVFVDADYSQIELRILAHCSGDEELIHAYKNASDIHRMTASQVFHTPFDEVTDLQRRNAKAVNFGIVYGISSFGLSQDLSISRKEAAEYIDRYFETYPRIKEFLDSTVSSAKEKGYTETIYGRRRPVPELSSGNFMQRSFGERVAMNAPIQGTAADIMKIAMLGVARALEERGLKSKLVLQVHDELLIEAHESEVELVKEILTEEMKKAAELKVPLDVDVHDGSNWYEAK